ncbi:hypothetical protein V2W30_14935 [Streptomyces sp. Q6]|uniref:Uncharacterized protein n=1 Tax=Streptomyces citrinus TaxID=3118173 RepID=A0ACD5ABF0_9ACTN
MTDSAPSARHRTVRPWQSLASLGVTESDLTTVHHRPVVPPRLPGDRPGERHHRRGPEGA